MMTTLADRALFSLLLLVYNKRGAFAQQMLQPAQVSCDARYSAPCSRTNAEWLARSVASRLLSAATPADVEELLQSVTSQQHNLDVGFYPFVFERETALCVAHGANAALVGLSLPEIFDYKGLGYSDANALHERLVAANNDWVQYLWADEGQVNSKLAFVVNITNSPYLLGVGYENEPLPADTPCSHEYDGWCSLTNVRSLVGKAQFALYQAESLAAFEATVHEISHDDEEYKIPEGFYLFMYHFDGPLKAHGRLREDKGGKSFFNRPMSEIFVENGLGTADDGRALHDQFVNAVKTQDSAFVQYEWKNKRHEDLYTKIGFLVKVSFGDDDYYLGAGYKFALDDFLSAPLGLGCSERSNLPCSFNTAYQLSAHALSHAVASPLPISQRFQAITVEDQFKHEDFYVFVYTFENECVAHGHNADFVGMSLNQVFDVIGLPLNATELHKKFRSAAQQGGGWVLYDWLDTKTGVGFEKISYVFQITLDGNNYYGGVGFHHQRAEVQPDANGREFENGCPIPCSPEFGLECSEVNARAILGQALATLTLSSSEASAVLAGDSSRPPLQVVLDEITNRSDELLSVNDFFVSVFSFSHNEACNATDNSGCAVAHGANPDFRGMTWAEILDAEGASSIQGAALHQRLMDASNTGGYVLQYPWQGSDKRAWTARFRHEEENYYIVAEYSQKEMPPTCEACPDGIMDCFLDEQDFCTEIPNKLLPTSVTVVLVLLLLLMIGLAWLYRRSVLKKRKYRVELEAFLNSIVGMQASTCDYVPQVSVAGRDEEEAAPAVSSDVSTRAIPVPMPPPTTTTIQWCWQETQGFMQNHQASAIHGDPVDCWVKYETNENNELEEAFQKRKETLSILSGNYTVDLKKFQQIKNATGFVRKIQRVEETTELPGPDDMMGVDPSLVQVGDKLPAELFREPQMVLVEGDVIQISRQRDDGWAFGTKLHHADEDHARKLLAFALGKAAKAGVKEEDANFYTDTGWFQTEYSRVPDSNDLEALRKTVGDVGGGSLDAPSHWDAVQDPTVAQKHILHKGHPEYDALIRSFSSTVAAKVVKVERIQNLAMYQSYVVKRSTICYRETGHDRSDDVAAQKKAIERFERKWLWHGSNVDVVGKIINQGFNRSFCGKNATAYGKGVYFARDASYSSHTLYSVPDHWGRQYMLACRVCVGEYCEGKVDALTPDVRDPTSHSLYDSTVGLLQNDTMANPSIYVTYHDAQAYPEYLITFSQK